MTEPKVTMVVCVTQATPVKIATEGGVNMSKIHVSAARLDESGGLVTATEEEEDSWAQNNGEKWGNELVPTVPDNE